jgi:hypothetical protein
MSGLAEHHDPPLRQNVQQGVYVCRVLQRLKVRCQGVG